MSFRINISPKSRKSANAISQIQETIQRAFVASGLRQQEVADKLDVDRSVINRRLKNSANLTLRSIAELAYAFDKDIVFDLVDPPEQTQPAEKNWGLPSKYGQLTGDGPTYFGTFGDN